MITATDSMLNNGYTETSDGELIRKNDDGTHSTISETYCEDTGRVNGYDLHRTWDDDFDFDSNHDTLEKACVAGLQWDDEDSDSRISNPTAGQ